jgi:hypothetical protein
MTKVAGRDKRTSLLGELKKVVSWRGVQTLMGGNLQVAWAELLAFKLGRFVIGQHIQAPLSLELKTRPRFCPVSLRLPMIMEKL